MTQLQSHPPASAATLLRTWRLQAYPMSTMSPKARVGSQWRQSGTAAPAPHCSSSPESREMGAGDPAFRDLDGDYDYEFIQFIVNRLTQNSLVYLRLFPNGTPSAASAIIRPHDFRGVCSFKSASISLELILSLSSASSSASIAPASPAPPTTPASPVSPMLSTSDLLPSS